MRGSTELGIAKKLHFSGRGIEALDAIEKDIITVIEQLKTQDGNDEVLLIVDQPDFLLAATGLNMGIGATEILDWVTGLQQVRDSGSHQSSEDQSGWTDLPTECVCYCNYSGCGFSTDS